MRLEVALLFSPRDDINSLFLLSVVELHLERNSFTGAIPTELGHLMALGKSLAPYCCMQSVAV